MKKSIFLGVMLAFTFVGWAQQQTKSPYEGAWKFVSLTEVSGNTSRIWKSDEIGNQVKMWTGNHFSFIGTMKNGSSYVDVYGYGTYTLNGKDYVEKIVFHNSKPLINTEYRCTLELRNDTLYQTNRTIDASGKETGYTVEKYIKADK